MREDEEIELTEQQWEATEPGEDPEERDDPPEGEHSHPPIKGDPNGSD